MFVHRCHRGVDITACDRVVELSVLGVVFGDTLRSENPILH